MRKKNEIIKQLKDFRCRLSNNPGHKHLYGFFDEIFTKLSTKEELQRDEIWEMEYVINDLISECRSYFYFKNYALKCYECANKLNSLIKNSKINIAEKVEGRLNPNDFICNLFLNYDDNNSIWIPSSKTKDFINRLKHDNDNGGIQKTIVILFQEANQGRRPRNNSSERSFKELTALGIDLLKYYISDSNNLDIFVKTKDFLNILSIQSSYEHLVSAIENTKDERSNRIFNNQAQILEEIIELQLEFFQLWIEQNPESFLIELNFQFVTDLMELYDDNRFEIFLKKIASIKNELSIKLIDFYLSDDEIEIRNLVKHLTND